MLKSFSLTCSVHISFYSAPNQLYFFVEFVQWVYNFQSLSLIFTWDVVVFYVPVLRACFFYIIARIFSPSIPYLKYHIYCICLQALKTVHMAVLLDLSDSSICSMLLVVVCALCHITMHVTLPRLKVLIHIITHNGKLFVLLNTY